MTPALAMKRPGLSVPRYFTRPERDPLDEVEWERRESTIRDDSGAPVHHRAHVEVPKAWSQVSTDVVAQKYLRRAGVPQPDGSLGPETSVRQLIRRVVLALRTTGEEHGYFGTPEDADAFDAELSYLLVNQRMAFNSPVWFNAGLWHAYNIQKLDGDNWVWDPQLQAARQEPNYYARPPLAACFIQPVADTINGPGGIMDLVAKEARLFRGGSGTGTSFHKIRGKGEPLSSGGTSSGLISFLKILDANAGSIKSGGTTRRAAKMAIVPINHPDVEEFIQWKATEERKARVLLEAGIGLGPDGRPDFNGEAYQTVSGQNSNNSLMLTDAFLQAVRDDGDWTLTARTTGQPWKTVKARHLWDQIARAAWECADPGVMFWDTIQKWNACRADGPINATNPCFPGDTNVLTSEGYLPIRQLVERIERGSAPDVYTSRATATKNLLSLGMVKSRPTRAWRNGIQKVCKIYFANGVTLRATRDHKLFTVNRGMVPAAQLTPSDDVLFAVEDTDFRGDRRIPISCRFEDYNQPSGTTPLARIRLPSRWTPQLGNFLGHLLGDGSVASGRQGAISLIYGTQAEYDALASRHIQFLQALGLRPSTAQMENGTIQVRVSSKALRAWLVALGFGQSDATQKCVPAAMMRAPKPVVCAFLAALFSADGCLVNQIDKQSRYVGLSSSSKSLLQGVQQLLFAFGVYGRIYDIHRSHYTGFSYTAKNGDRRTYPRGSEHDLRISAQHLVAFADRVGFADDASRKELKTMTQTYTFYSKPPTSTVVRLEDDGEEQVFDLEEPVHHSYAAGGVVVSNCAEYVFHDNTSCNLASLNLLKFWTSNAGFDVAGFHAAIRLTVLAMDLVVTLGSFPSREVAEGTARHRTLGLGYTNLGALLMVNGLPYDSPEGRAYAAAVSAVLGSQAYVASAELAQGLGAYPGFERNRAGHLDVVRRHLEHSRELHDEVDPFILVPPAAGKGAPPDLRRLQDSASASYAAALLLGEQHGFRNAQLTAIAPTGTISFLMSCATTGIEPDYGLVKTKKLAGGGTLRLVNTAVPAALATLGYSEAETVEIQRHVEAHGTVEGALHLKLEHYAVFDCAVPAREGGRCIPWRAHVQMVAAVQPFVSGSVSKTVNLPAAATVQDIQEAYALAHRLGLKNLSVYRDGCKSSQPLSTGSPKQSAVAPQASTFAGDADEWLAKQPPQTLAQLWKTHIEPKLPHLGWGFKQPIPHHAERVFHQWWTVGGVKHHLTLTYIRPNGKWMLNQVFWNAGDQGSTLYEHCRHLAMAWSLLLRYGAKPADLARDHVGSHGFGGGLTDHPVIRSATSATDFVWKLVLLEGQGEHAFVHPEIWNAYQARLDRPPFIHEELARDASTPAPRSERNILDYVEGNGFQPRPSLDGLKCPNCGASGASILTTGTCKTCAECGTTIGGC